MREGESYRVGLTGSVAAGKSVVGRRFEELGAFRIDADDLAREVVAPGTPALARIRAIWGDEALTADGTLDRAAMRRLVFDDEGARARLEAIVHAAIAERRETLAAEATEEGALVIVDEIPLLYETNLAEGFDAIVVVDAPTDVRAERAATSRGWTEEEFRAIDAAQLSPEEKRARADFVIDNDRDLEALHRLVAETWDQVVDAARRRVVDDPGHPS
ncbi:MAG: dephospho-CoA kinase [Gemmatimonadetes bacterium]|nr:dephospho-CoA kinase [Gemmatimonadota bacterium]